MTDVMVNDRYNNECHATKKFVGRTFHEIRRNISNSFPGPLSLSVEEPKAVSIKYCR